MNEVLKDMLQKRITTGLTLEQVIDTYKDYLLIDKDDLELLFEVRNEELDEKYGQGFCVGLCWGCKAHDDYILNSEENLPNGGFGTLDACANCDKKGLIDRHILR